MTTGIVRVVSCVSWGQFLFLIFGLEFGHQLIHDANTGVNQLNLPTGALG